METAPKGKRPTVGLDVPCKKCGRPIYFNYKGPVEGLCGRCSDGARTTARFGNSRRIGKFVGRGRRVRQASGALLVVVIVAVALYFLYRYL